jgi:hypothetical protein
MVQAVVVLTCRWLPDTESPVRGSCPAWIPDPVTPIRLGRARALVGQQPASAPIAQWIERLPPKQ